MKHETGSMIIPPLPPLKKGGWGGIFLLLASCFVLLRVINSQADSISISSIQSAYRSVADLSADFTQDTYVAVLEKNVKERGKFYMKKPGMARIDYTGAHPKNYISNGKTMWVVTPELNQYEKYRISDAKVPKEALTLLSGFGEIEKLFTVKNAGGFFKLTPKKRNSQYRSLDCWFGTDNFLKKMAIHNNSGNISTYVFSNIKVNVGLEDGLFNYK